MRQWGVVTGFVLAVVLTGNALAQQVPNLVCQTVNGPMTGDQLRQQLAAASYSGPWDDWATEAAYTRASGGSVSCAQNGLWSTSSGQKTFDQMKAELTTAGYGGPWDSASVVGAYMRTAQSNQPVSAVPVPAQAPPPAPAAPSDRTIVVQIGGIGSVWGDTKFSQLESVLTGQYGYQARDFFNFSYDGWHVDAGSSTMTTNSYTPDETCQDIIESERLLASMLRFLRDSHWASHVVLVGHSLGGVLAYDVVTNQTDLSSGPQPFIRGVITVDSPLGGLGPWSTVGAGLAFDTSLDCIAADELNGRLSQGAPWQKWLTSSAQAALNRKVGLMLVENTEDYVVGSLQGVNGVPINYPMTVSGPGETHSAVFFDPTSVQKMAAFIGSQGK